MIPPFPVYLFDVDGTLMDSAADILATQREVLAAAGFQRELPDAFLKRYIGRHLIDLYSDLGIGAGTADPMQAIDPLVEHYRALYRQRGHVGTRVYPGVAAMLQRLGGQKSTATTKGSNSTRSILELFGLIGHFDHVQGTDGFPAKPEPDVIHASLRVLGVRAEDCLFVGDSAADMEAGRRAGVRICAVRWGYGDPEELARWEPDYWLDEPGQLLPAAPGRGAGA